MHIRSFIGAALLSLAMLAFAPAAMADPQPDICILDLSPTASVDYALDAVPDMHCDVVAAALHNVDMFEHIRGAQGEAARPLAAVTTHPLDHTGRRLHFDPGRTLG